MNGDGHPGFEVDTDVIIDQLRAMESRRFNRLDSRILIKRIAPLNPERLRKVERCLQALLDLA